MSSPHPPAPLRRLAPVLLGLVLLLPLHACASGGGGGGDPFGEPPGEGTIRIDVENRHFNEANLHIFRGAERIRLGTVTGKSDGTFRVAWDIPRPARIRIDLVGQPACVTSELMTDPGDILYLDIPPYFESGEDCRLRR